MGPIVEVGNERAFWAGVHGQGRSPLVRTSPVHPRNRAPLSPPQYELLGMSGPGPSGHLSVERTVKASLTIPDNVDRPRLDHAERSSKPRR